jgi:hypothetical protein
LAQGGGDLLDLGALCLSRRAQLHRLSAAVEKRDTDIVLDLPDAAREGRLRQVSTLRRSAERSGLRDGKDVFQPFKPHGAPLTCNLCKIVGKFRICNWLCPD